MVGTTGDFECSIFNDVYQRNFIEEILSKDGITGMSTRDLDSPT
jgi:hypothetical protein